MSPNKKRQPGFRQRNDGAKPSKELRDNWHEGETHQWQKLKVKKRNQTAKVGIGSKG